MHHLSRLLSVALAGALIVPAPLVARAASTPRDLWVHPRAEAFDPSRHYRDGAGNLYYHEENDLGSSVESIQISPVENRIRVALGREIMEKASRTGGALVPVLLYDSDEDGRVDTTLLGRIEASEALFEGSAIGELDFDSSRWQLAIRYAAGPTGEASLDGRYLASVDGRDAHSGILRAVPSAQAPPPPEPETPEVGAGPLLPGLVVLKHREGTPFDLAGFVEQPSRYIEHFDALTRTADGDDWTVEGEHGRLTTHFDHEDLLLVRTQGGFDLQITWGDVAFQQFLEQFLEVPRDPQGCYVSLNTEMRNPDGTRVVTPHRFLYCPEVPIALFDAPDGYQVDLRATRNGTAREHTEIGNSIPDNIRLYVQEVYPRHPSRRATGSVSGNIAAGFRDARGDLSDAFRHVVTGVEERHLHTGQLRYRPSPLSAPPRAVFALLRLRPLGAIGELLEGAESAVQAGADVVSAIDNTALTTLLQTTLSAPFSTRTADTAGDWIGALTQSFVKNLPFGERSNGVMDLRGSWRHDRAFEPARYTRTDTQLNLDRGMTVINWSTLRGIQIHNRSSHGGPKASPDFLLPGDGTPETPGPCR